MLRRLGIRLERRFLYRTIRFFRIRGESEKVARGFAIGMVVNFFPTFGFGVFVSGFIARFFGGNVLSGIAGGATLTFVWPLLFYLNIRAGSLFLRPSVRVVDLEDVTEKTVNALVWGQTFLLGAVINSLLVGLVIYVLLRLLYERTRPVALAYFRRHAQDHQLRLRRHAAILSKARRTGPDEPAASG
ncbi:MAG: DUF2062 domain-containing protein [Verrucomicrobiae bacterium]|nr:DUF2062 domain-containing protein [Verrucomicrobiae bacterium]